ncbi:MAG: type II 3-dehydroquinate dehydratase [Novosphingobium sp.]
MAGTILVLNGPNLDLLGEREPEIYGRTTLAEIEAQCRAVTDTAGFTLDFRQTGTEHIMLEWIQKHRTGLAGIVINPAAFSYAAYSILDALLMVDCPVIEVHISNLHRREAPWRANSIITQGVTGIVSGLGAAGYVHAVRHLTGQ